MRFYTDENIDHGDVIAFNQICSALRTLSDSLELGVGEDGERIILSCHIIARAVENVFSLQCIDGRYWNSGYPHSWNIAPSGRAIIDAYPIATYGGPKLVDLSLGSPQRFLYEERDISREFLERIGERRFLRAVRIVTEELSRIRAIQAEMLL